jgi:hypothetical protein
MHGWSTGPARQRRTRSRWPRLIRRWADRAGLVLVTRRGAGSLVHCDQVWWERCGVEPGGADPVLHRGDVVVGAQRADPDRGTGRSALGVAGLHDQHRTGRTKPAGQRVQGAPGHDQDTVPGGAHALSQHRVALCDVAVWQAGAAQKTKV